MRTGSILATIVAIVFFVSPGDIVASADDDAIGELKRCAAVEDPASRFACYDALGQRVLAAEASVIAAAPAETSAPEPALESSAPEPVVEAPAAAAAAAAVAEVPAASAPATTPAPEAVPDDLGRPKKEEKKKNEEPSIYSAHVRSCRESVDGIWYFTFDNGQVWYQSSRGHHRFETCDFDVTIKKDFFGYKMSIDGGRTLRVRRQR